MITKSVRIGLGAATAALALTAGALTTARAAQATTFMFSGAPEEFTVPTGVCSLRVTAYGAAGGDAVYGSKGGKGGEVRGTLKVSPGQRLTVNVGGAGSGGSFSDPNDHPRGGYGGGGRGGAYNDDPRPGNGAIGAGGGGATTVSHAGTTLLIAGGGGGGAGSFANDDSGRGGDGGQFGTAGITPAHPGSGHGGQSGGNGGTGGAGGTPTDVSDHAGLPGGNASGRTGGDGALNVGDPHMGTGGGGGGGAHGGGAGGSSTPATTYGGGGGGGSSLGPAGAAFITGARTGNGEVVFSYAENCTAPTPKPTHTRHPKPHHHPACRVIGGRACLAEGAGHLAEQAV